jgi:hypothetical protein
MDYLPVSTLALIATVVSLILLPRSKIDCSTQVECLIDEWSSGYHRQHNLSPNLQYACAYFSHLNDINQWLTYWKGVGIRPNPALRTLEKLLVHGRWSISKADVQGLSSYDFFCSPAE